MKLLSVLRPAEGSRHKKKRVGRGESSGWGKTAGKGHKGQRSRSGGGVRPGFEGGQMPLARRLPKFGFVALNHKEYNIINLNKLSEVAERLGVDTIDIELLMEHNIVKQRRDGLRVLGMGTLSKPLTIRANHFSKSAIEKIEAAGGKAEVI